MRNRIKKLLFALVALALVSGLGFSGQAHGCTPLVFHIHNFDYRRRGRDRLRLTPTLFACQVPLP